MKLRIFSQRGILKEPSDYLKEPLYYLKEPSI